VTVAMAEDLDYQRADQVFHEFDPYAQEKYRILRTEVLPRRRWGRALNVGWGTGEVNLILAPHCEQVTSLDPDEVAMTRAEDIARSARLTNVETLHGPLEQLPPSGPFDLIVAIDVLERFEDDAAAVAALARRLAPGGVLFLTAPAGPALVGEHDRRLGHRRRYTRERLVALLAPAFSLERCAYFGAALVPVAFAFAHLLRHTYPLEPGLAVGLAARLLRRVLRLEARTDALPCGTSLVVVAHSRAAGVPASHPPKWPKRLTPETAEQRRISDDFMRRWHEVLPGRYALIERFNHGHPARRARAPFERTLELGAGRGEHLDREGLTPQQRRGYHMLEMRENLCQVLRERHPDAVVIQGDCQRRLDFPDEHFDRILAIHVLEHLPDLPATIREAWRLCSKRGLFQVVIPCEGGLSYGVARRVSAQRLFESEFKQSYSRHIEREHINDPHEVLEELDPYFEVVERDFFPFKVPSVHLNLVIGLTLRPRATPLQGAP